MACTMGVFKVQVDSTTSTPLSSPIPFIPAMVLPEPTYTPPDLNKKPHARKQPPGHIPRPRNPFILFRCDYVRQKKIPSQVEKDHRNISRIVGQIWRQMSEEQREPWVLMADKEKLAHSKLYPSYRFATGTSNKKSKRGDDIPHETQKTEDPNLWDDSDMRDLYRSSSCPPGTLHVPQANLESSNGYGTPLKTRDDMTRRPSRVATYQSTSHQSASPSITQEEFTADTNDQHYSAEFLREDYFKAVANQDYYTEAEEWKATFDKDTPEQRDLKAKFCGPRIDLHPYPTPGPNDAPEWDVALMQPHTWTDWSTFNFNHSSNSNGTDINKPFFTDPFLSTLPPLPHSCDPQDTFSPIDYVLQPPFTALETDAYSSLERFKLSDAHPEYVQNIARYHPNTSHNHPFQNFGYHDSNELYQKSSFSGLPADFRGRMGY